MGSLLCAVSLANGAQQTDNGRPRTVVHCNVPRKVHLTRRVIAGLLFALCYRAIRPRRARPFSAGASHLDRTKVNMWRLE